MKSGIELAIERLSRTVMEEERKFLAFISKQPQSITCRVHPDCNRQIDKNYKDKVGGQFKARYLPCIKCQNEARQKVERERLHSCGVPDNLIHATFDNLKPESDAAGHVEDTKEFCNAGRGFLVMLGGVGTGKSHLAVASFRFFGNGWFIKHSSLLNALRATYRDRAAFDPIDRANSARLFVLDDVGLSAGGRDELPLLHQILDYRHGERLPTIITSNLSWENLRDFLGDRMADRLRESTFRVLTFTGTSQRSIARERYFEVNKSSGIAAASDAQRRRTNS